MSEIIKIIIACLVWIAVCIVVSVAGYAIALGVTPKNEEDEQ